MSFNYIDTTNVRLRNGYENLLNSCLTKDDELRVGHFTLICRPCDGHINMILVDGETPDQPFTVSEEEFDELQHFASDYYREHRESDSEFDNPSCVD